MITSQECNRYKDECHLVGIDPKSSNRRATAAMAVCRVLILLGAEIAIYERVIANEEKVTPVGGLVLRD
jgi:hypothetical protein